MSFKAMNMKTIEMRQGLIDLVGTPFGNPLIYICCLFR